jgi:hypothetical protein
MIQVPYQMIRIKNSGKHINIFYLPLCLITASEAGMMEQDGYEFYMGIFRLITKCFAL